MTEQLIIVGASARAAAFSAIGAGFQPYAIDQYADSDLAAACPAVRIERYPHDFLAAMHDAPEAPWVYTGGLENYPRLVDHLAELRPLWGNRGDVLRRVRDPSLLADAVRDAGLQFPPAVRELTQITAHQMDAYWLQKPFRSCGGLRIHVVDGPQPASRWHYYQTYLRGWPVSGVFLAAQGSCRLLGVSRQLQGAFGEFTYLGSIVSPEVWYGDLPQWSRLGAVLAARFELRGIFNVDFIVNSQGHWPLEVNPRYSASVEVLERATGPNFLALHAAAFDPARQAALASLPVPPPDRAVGKAIVYAESDGSVPPDFDELVARWNGDSARPGIADLPRVGDIFRRGQPICTVFAEGATRDQAERELSLRADRVRRLLVGAPSLRD